MDFNTKYRINKLDDIIGNEETIKLLKSFVGKKHHPHSYLFTGERGMGKTTIGRILAKEFDCGDVIELNTANNRGIDTARDIIEKSQFKSLDGKNKCYLMDEVHKMTNDGQNALLKILEEPPVHVYFILCTTNPEKLIKPLKSRCQKFEVEKILVSDMIEYLQLICEKEDKQISKSVLRQIAKTSEGCMRDALLILEKVVSVEDEETQLKIASQKYDEDNAEVIELCRELLKSKNWNKVKELLKKMDLSDPESIRYMVIGYMSKVLLNNDYNAMSLQAANVIESLKEPTFNSGKAGLILACFGVFV